MPPPVPNPHTILKTMKGWRSSLAAFIPYWQSWRGAELRVGWTFLQAMATPVDIERELLFQSANDAAPGSPNSAPDALPLIANSRGLIQGEEESDPHFAQRCLNFRTTGLVDAPAGDPQTWSERGRSERLAQQLQEFISGRPTVRVIERVYSVAPAVPQAWYVTANPDGTTARVLANWDWDSVLGWTDDRETWTGDQCRKFWSDFWVVIDLSPYSLTGSVTPLTGMRIPLSSRDAIRRIVGDWHGAYTFCRSVIYSYNAALFDPATPSHAGNPDGTWGNQAKFDSGSGLWLPARNITDARYDDLAKGGN